jgi:hypothetical protein
MARMGSLWLVGFFKSGYPEIQAIFAVDMLV